MRFGQEWKIERRINNDLPVFGSVCVKHFAPNHVLWTETIQTPLQSGNVIEGQTIYEVILQNGGLKIYFAAGEQKGNLFQTFDLRKVEQASEHFCDPDHYTSHLQLLSADNMIVCHEVTGPRKNYKMKSIYQKIS